MKSGSPPKARVPSSTESRRLSASNAAGNADCAATAAASALFAASGAFRDALLGWFAQMRRPMPWRDSPSLYKTVVSEFMLQQTQVGTALPYFERWLRRWPDFAALAAASEGEVVREWEGLGYYNRARNLRKLAGQVAAMPELPRTAAAWRTLPGVGPYTAAAIASIACGECVAVVDGNVARVLARLMAEAQVFKDNGAAAKFFADAAQRLLSPLDPGGHNQAMMELGALVCRPQSPCCVICPVADFCAAVKRAAPEEYPHFLPRRIAKIATTRLWLVRDGSLLLQRHAGGAKRLSGLCELPDAATLLTPAALRTAKVLALKHRAISNQQITETIVAPAVVPIGTPAVAPVAETFADADALAAKNLFWAPLSELPALTLSGPHRKWISELLRTAD
ncbi:MAG: A/G-specific adenine glycosylase [Puniceicoccales bacterium]|jgi:A/G-specific adenine glycosylase|nr:A/G-specific adenine glycosylase [Puniceicoccales bacterium]